jgi:type II secretion system protein I
VRADTPQSNAGFTLIEVLVALVVVGLGMLAVIQTVSQTASNTSYIRDKTIAHWIAMNQLTQVRLQPSAPPIDKSSDELEMAGRTQVALDHGSETNAGRIDPSHRSQRARLGCP